MKLRDHYDWVVLGDHPGALLSAGLAARLGLSVLVLPVFPGKGLRISSDGRFADLEPNYMLSLGRIPRFSGLLSECLSRLGILPAELVQIVGEDPVSQVLSPRLRLEFSPDDERLEHSLSRELGKAVAQQSGLLAALKRAEAEYLSFWLQLPERLTLSPGKKSVARTSSLRVKDLKRKIAKDAAHQAHSRWFGRGHQISRLGEDLKTPALVELLEGFWFGATGSAPDDPRLEDLLHLLVLARTGASYRGGITAYREFLLRLAKRLGAHVPAKLECKRIFVDKGRFTGVQVAGRANVVAGGGAVAGCGLSQLGTLISVSGQGWWRKLKPSPAAIGWRFTISLTVGAAAVPPGASSRMTWKEAEAPPIEIEITDPDPATTVSNRKALKVVQLRTILPYLAETLQPEYQKRVAARMVRQLMEILPFCETHWVSAYPEFRGPGDTELNDVYGFPDLASIPENLRCLRSTRGAGVGAHSGIEGLFVASGESFPEFGTFGSTVAALESVSWLAHRAGLSGPFA